MTTINLPYLHCMLGDPGKSFERTIGIKEAREIYNFWKKPAADSLQMQRKPIGDTIVDCNSWQWRAACEIVSTWRKIITLVIKHSVV
jgi:hypothetical protein